MKKIFSILALALLVSSCGNKMTLIKRHYTKGYYVPHIKHANETTVASTSKTTKGVTKMQPTVASLMNDKKNVQPEYTASLKNNSAEEKAVKRTYSGQLKKHVDLQKKEVSSFFYTPVIKIKPVTQKIKSENKKGGGEANLIVLIIFSFFPILSLIAMYLHDGHKVTTNFWVDLLFYLTFIGYIVYALLVVLDVVDLS